ncbi:MAG TPA: hypothetical protein VF862_11565 [Gemmatimonadales bacterium]
MRALLSLLVAVVALSLTPAGLWAEEHGHCEEPVVAQPAAPMTVFAAHGELSAPTGPCGDCTDASCTSHRQCAAGTVPVVAEAPLTEADLPPASSAGLRSPAGLGPSFDPTPPTPPPNLRPR